MLLHSADWNLLFGMLALQNGLVTREQLVSAFARWTSDKSQSLHEILIADGAIDEATCNTLRPLVELHVTRNGGDPQKSLMSLSGSDVPAITDDLARLDDSELIKSLAAVVNRDPPVTMPTTVGQSTSSGGRFRILRPLPGARGGMGEISVAEDDELGRHVALKQIVVDKADHPDYREKFRAEAEITGNLEHPGIVPVYGLGAGPDGRPYYAMRLVHGDNLNARIKQFHQAPDGGSVDYNSVEFHGLIDRLIDVAQAIRYAHSRGILHRDLKPGNILVGEYGETLVIDWGLARLPRLEDSDPSGDTTSHGIDEQPPLQIRSGSHVDATMQGQALGTVGYAPPEQLNGRVDLISMRSDVYALGAILYEILTGRPPIIGQGTNRDLDELIQETIAGKITPPRQITRSIPKSLSAVCMRALAREPDDRYRSVGSFVDEIERWKADQPVVAAPDTIADRVLRLARRYRAAALAAAAALLGIAIVAGIALVVVNRARVNEAAARGNAEALAKEKAELAERNQTVVDTFVAAFRSADPENEGVTHEMTALQVLEQALAQIETDDEWTTDELTKATLLEAIGTSLRALGAYDQAISAAEETLRLRKANLGDEHPETLASMGNLASVYRSAGRLEDALPLYEETLRLIKAKLGVEHPNTLTSMNNLAQGYQLAGRLEQALPLYEETLRLQKANLGAEHPQTLASMNNLASGYESAGRLEDALPLYAETLRLRKAQLGDEHPSTLVSMNNLALGYRSAGRLEEALPLLEETFRLMKAKLGAEHPKTLNSMISLAEGYRSAGRLERALPLLEETLRLVKAKLGADHPSTLASMNNLAVGYKSAGRLEQALPLFEETLRLVKAKLGADHPSTLHCMGNLAAGYESAGRLEEALPLLEETLRQKKVKLGDEHPSTLHSMGDLALGYESAGRLEQALPLYAETLRLQKAKLGGEHPDTLLTFRGLQAALLEAGNFEEAKKQVEDWTAILAKLTTPDQAQLARAATSHAEALLGLESYVQAKQRIAMALEIAEMTDLQRLRANSIQGAIFASEGSWEEAEALQLKSAESLAKQLADMKSQFRWYVPRAHERVIAMYEAWGKPDEVKEWQKKLDRVNGEIERLRQHPKSRKQ